MSAPGMPRDPRAAAGPHRHRLALCAVAVALGAAACSQPEDDNPGTHDTAPAPCAEVTRFGNAELCDASDPDLSACGTRPRRTCASSRLCFDAPELAFCTCETDADCQGRTDYINAGRLKRHIAPIGPSCKGGRCQGAP